MTLHTLFTQKNRPNIFWLVFFALILLLISGLYLYLRFGIPSYSHRQLIETLSHPFKGSPAQNIIIDLRLPRGIAALLVGASLAVSGAIMQGITRNAIADPGLLGINSGAGLALICGYAFSKSIHYSSILLLSLAGACLASILVFSLSYHPRKGFEQLRLVLSGAMVTTLLTAIGQGLTIYLNLTNAVIGWQAGGLLGTNWKMLQIIAPFILLGLLLAQLFSHQLTILSLNETVAKGLGQRTTQITLFFLSIVLLLSAAAVALVGSLALVGLIIPHFVKTISGKNYQKILPLTMLTGALFLLICDFAASHMVGLPLSSIISLVTLPVFLWLMRKGPSMRDKKRILLVLVSLSLLTFLIFLLSLSSGDQEFNIGEAFRYLLGQGDDGSAFIMEQIRLPRILVCLLAGASLGMSGVLLQIFTRNPLADSGTLGINAGAGVIITLAISKLEVTDPFYIRYLPFIATFGGMMTVALIYLISHQKGQAISPVKLIIAGVTLSTILSSSMIAITGRVNQNKLTYVVSWLAGKITGNNWESLAIAGPFLLLFWLLTYLRSHKLNILSLNDETALGLGLHLKRERQITLLLASALVAFSLSLAGNIVFIGMLASHISKRFLPSDHRLLFPVAMLLGAFIMTGADTITRTFLIGSSVPTGILISIIGAPYFLYLMYQQKK